MTFIIAIEKEDGKNVYISGQMSALMFFLFKLLTELFQVQNYLDWKIKAEKKLNQ